MIGRVGGWGGGGGGGDLWCGEIGGPGGDEGEAVENGLGVES